MKVDAWTPAVATTTRDGTPLVWCLQCGSDQVDVKSTDDRVRCRSCGKFSDQVDIKKLREKHYEKKH